MPRWPDLIGHCQNCGRILPKHVRLGRQRKWCVGCKKARIRRQNEESRLRKVASKDSPARTWNEASYLAAGGATQRQLADDTLDAGGQRRRCQTCGRLYLLDKFDTPCPDCASHLIPLPGGPYVEEP